jgi:hypothetical protein
MFLILNINLILFPATSRNQTAGEPNVDSRLFHVGEDSISRADSGGIKIRIRIKKTLHIRAMDSHLFQPGGRHGHEDQDENGKTQPAEKQTSAGERG